MFIRRNVWNLGGHWADPILWYARGVEAMKSRALADPTSWRFYGAIHGIDPALWVRLGYLSVSEPFPSQNDIRRFWVQCQHGSWYFLPWHRGYLLAFEAVVRAAVLELGGPSDWSLPYWNYFKDGQNQLPFEFASPDWPDGQSNNPLFVTQRYGPNGDGDVFVPLSLVNLNAMTEPDFAGVDSGGSPGFGGVDTGFSHSGQVHGRLETQPHDWVHGLVGGAGGDPQNPGTEISGLMSDPDTAGLDPIFWLHHANIDRLWEVWRQNPPEHVDPSNSNWLNGPASFGERGFAMPMPEGIVWDFTPSQMSNLADLGYTYDDLSPAVAPDALRDRLVRLGARAAAAEEVAMSSKERVELVGSSEAAVPIHGSEVRASVRLHAAPRAKVAASLAAAAESVAPDRVFLNLENVRGLVDSVAFQVYVGVPKGASPEDYPDRLAGSIGLFGVRKASLPTAEHGGQGLTFVLEITKIVDALHLSDEFDVDSLDLRLVPIRSVPESAQIRIGRVSLFRQGSQ